MIYDLNEIAMLPDTFSLEDLRVVCHISKRTARYYLRAGLIPCEISDKKTHCYTIRKEDLLDALKEYQKQPCKFVIPKALNDEKRQRQEALKMMVEQRILSINCLPEKDLKSTTLKKYYQKRLENCRDMLQPPDIESITGYPRKIVRRWCVEDKLHCIMLDSRTALCANHRHILTIYTRSTERFTEEAKMMKDRMIQNGIEYERKGEQYYPLLDLGEQTSYQIGKYGKLHLEFIKKHRRGTYTTLMTENRLNEHLHSIDEQAHEQLDLLTTQMAERMGVTEELKASEPMRWVQMTNNIKASAEEIVLKEVVYR